MNVVDQAVIRSSQRRAAREAAAREAQAGPDSYADKLAQAEAEIYASRARSEASFGALREHAPSAPPAPLPAWDVDTHQVIMGIEKTTRLHLELRRLVDQAGIDNIVAGLRAMGFVKPSS